MPRNHPEYERGYTEGFDAGTRFQAERTPPSDAEQLIQLRKLVREFLTIDPAKDVARWCEIEQKLERLVGIDLKKEATAP